MFDLVIIGAGPAGIACAIEAQKAGLSYCIVEKGKLVNSIYNFPYNMTFFSTSVNLEIGDIPFISHNDKPTRTEALEYYRRIVQAYQLNIRFKHKVEDVQKKDDLFKLIITGKPEIKASNVVIATGYYDNPRKLNVPGEDLDKVKHYYDDAHPYIGMKVLVIGAANSACDVALETWQKGADVTMAVREAELYHKVKYWILPNIKNRIKEGSIQAYFNTTVSEIKPNSVVLDVQGQPIEIENDYVLAMTGYRPDFKFLEHIGIHLDKKNDCIPQIDEKSLQSNIPGIYIAGVVVSGLQTSTLFIENTRHHGKKIVEDIVCKSKD